MLQRRFNHNPAWVISLNINEDLRKAVAKAAAHDGLAQSEFITSVLRYAIDKEIHFRKEVKIEVFSGAE